MKANERRKEGRVLGAFASYYTHLQLAHEQDRELIERAVQSSPIADCKR